MAHLSPAGGAAQAPGAIAAALALAIREPGQGRAMRMGGAQGVERGGQEGRRLEGLERFVEAQEGSWPIALAELRRGRKESHWMWWIFPQLATLGYSATSKHYGLADLAEARAYLAHPVLGPRLLEAARAMLVHAGQDPARILGQVDAAKLRSSATLFAALPEAPPEFQALLDAFHGGEADPRTLGAIAPG